MWAGCWKIEKNIKLEFKKDKKTWHGMHFINGTRIGAVGDTPIWLTGTVHMI